ncbi:MAG: NADH:flavin oxidoreductase/NADH oxidase [Albimonas sp.]|uniref:NADH:flavin oxidoreductase/NADH oxidase n=1 Tax=Albimonas sp. TaxID=1872425 RepID=UPI0040567364
MTTPLLFTPLELRGVHLRNRVVVPPMLQYKGEAGLPVDWHAINVGRFAAGGAGLVFVESTKVERRGAGTVGDLLLSEDRFIEPISRLARVIAENGSVPGIQLGHSGRKARGRFPWQERGPLERSPEIPDFDEWEPVAPSAVPFAEGWPAPRALELSELPPLIDAWAQAARRAHQAGFEVLELHVAHGFLLHSFLSPHANRREDAYGGSEANRMRFPLEVIEAVRAQWPEEKPLFLRLSMEDDAGWGPDENIRFVRAAKPLGVDAIDCSSGGTTDKPPSLPTVNTYGFQVPWAAKLRREAEIPTMAVGLIIHGDQAERILQDGDADLIAVGREFLHNPNWAVDAALKLGLDGYDAAPVQAGWWLTQRAKRGFGGNPSTWQTGRAADD